MAATVRIPLHTSPYGIRFSKSRDLDEGIANRHHQRSAALKVDWAKISTSLGLKGSTAASLQAFKKRNDDARRKLNLLQSQPQNVDFASFRSQLSNQAIVDEVEAHLKGFKPATYDLGRQLKAIDAFEAQAVKQAEETKGKVDEQLNDLERTLKNIEETRSIDELTVVRNRLMILLTSFSSLYSEHD